MRQYLSTIHERSDQHKRRFSYVVAGTFTLFIFVVWSLVKFGLPGSGTVAESPSRETARGQEVDLRNGMAAAWTAMKANVLGVEKAVEGLQQVR